MKNKAEIAKKEKPKANISKNFKQPKEKKTFKKFKPKEKSEKSVKVILNLTKTSQNWKNLAPELPKPRFKRKKTDETKKPTDSKVEEKKESTLEEEKSKIWFDVDNAFIPELNKEKTTDEISQALNDSSRKDIDPSKIKITKVVAIDCEMVGVGENGKDSIVARVSLVNQYGDCIYDKYVIPTEPVTDYRTNVSGVRPEDLKKSNNAVSFSVVQKEVADIIKGRVLVGHAVHNDLQVLYLSHEKKKIRDTQKCKVFRRIYPSLGGLSSLKNLAKLLLGISIQEGEHSSVLDAQAVMRIYTMYKKDWEADIRNRKSKSKEEKPDKSELLKATYLQAEGIEIKSGNDTHKKYLINKLKKRNKFGKKFKK